MEQSNIFAFIELSKMVQELNGAISKEDLKKKLQRQSAYFKIIEPHYFSESLETKWISILALANKEDVKRDQHGRIISCAVRNSINNLTVHECTELTTMISEVYERLKMEFS